MAGLGVQVHQGLQKEGHVHEVDACMDHRCQQIDVLLLHITTWLLGLVA